MESGLADLQVGLNTGRGSGSGSWRWPATGSCRAAWLLLPLCPHQRPTAGRLRAPGVDDRRMLLPTWLQNSTGTPASTILRMPAALLFLAWSRMLSGLNPARDIATIGGRAPDGRG